MSVSISATPSLPPLYRPLFLLCPEIWALPATILNEEFDKRSDALVSFFFLPSCFTGHLYFLFRLLPVTQFPSTAVTANIASKQMPV